MRSADHRRGRALLAGALVIAGAPRVLAGNSDELFVGNQAAMVGGAVVATVEDGSATYYNPAGLGAVDRARIDVGGSVYALRFQDVDKFLRSRQGGQRNASVQEFIAVPTQATFARRVADGVTLGFGYFQPRASNLVLRERLDETDGSTTARSAVNTIQIASEFVLGAVVGLAPLPSLRVGGGLLATYDDVTNSESLFASVAGPTGVQKVQQVDLLATQTIVAIAPTLGTQWDVTPELTLGVAARGPRASLFNRGEVRRDAAAAADDGAPPSSDTVTGSIAGDAMDIVRAGRYFLGAAYRLGATQISVEGDAEPPLQNESANVHRDGAWNARAGVYHQATAQVGVGAGVFTDNETEAPDDDGIFAMRGNYYGGTLGVRVSNEHDLAPDEPADQLIFTSVFALKYAFSSGSSVALAFDRDAPAQALFERAQSSAHAHEVIFYVGSGLHF